MRRDLGSRGEGETVAYVGNEGTKLSARFGSASGADRVAGGPRSRGRSSGRRLRLRFEMTDKGSGYGDDGGHSGGHVKDKIQNTGPGRRISREEDERVCGRANDEA